MGAICPLWGQKQLKHLLFSSTCAVRLQHQGNLRKQLRGVTAAERGHGLHPGGGSHKFCCRKDKLRGGEEEEEEEEI